VFDYEYTTPRRLSNQRFVATWLLKKEGDWLHNRLYPPKLSDTISLRLALLTVRRGQASHDFGGKAREVRLVANGGKYARSTNDLAGTS
jgi:hypothetical protein